jgi:hypothetical protein
VYAQASTACWTYSTEAVISPNKLNLVDITCLTAIVVRTVCEGHFLFRKEPVAFSRLEALTNHFSVHFRHALPGPTVKPETQIALNVLY